MATNMAESFLDMGTGSRESFPENPQKSDASPVITFAINGRRYSVNNPAPTITLSDFLRETIKQTGTKVGCGEGGCGACAVLVTNKDGVSRTINSCLKPLVTLDGLAVKTTEGLGTVNAIHPVQQRIADFNGMQCGFCTPGMVMSIYGAMVKSNESGAAFTAAAAERAIDGNLCRCTGYRPILDAAKSFSADGGVEDQVGCCGGAARKAVVEGYDIKPEEVAFPDFLETSPRMLQINGPGQQWMQPTTMAQLFELLRTHPDAKLENARTSKGIYKEDFMQESIINVSRVPELSTIEQNKVGVVFGAGVTISTFIDTLTASDNDFDVLVQHASKIAGTHVRNAGTIGGNVMMAAAQAFPSDLATILLGAGATATIASSSASSAAASMRTVDLLVLLQSGGVAQGELLVSITVPAPEPATLFKTYRVAVRPQNAHALLNAAFRVKLDTATGSIVEDAVLVIGGVDAPHAQRMSATEKCLVGKQLRATNYKDLAAVLAGALSTLEAEVVSMGLVKGNDKRAQYRRALATKFLYKFSLAIVHREGAVVSPTDKLALAAEQIPDTRPTSVGGVQRVCPTPKQLAEHSPVGAPVQKIEAPLLATGEAQFTDDFPLPAGSLYAAYVSAPQKGIVDAIDTAAAAAAPGVVAVLTAADVPGKNNCGPWYADPILTKPGEAVQFAGQGVVLVVADTSRNASIAAKLVKISFKAPEEGEDGAPVLTNKQAIEADSMFVGMKRHHTRGDATKGLASCAHTVKGSCASGSQSHFYMEPHCAWAVPDEDGTMKVGSSMQWPNGVQGAVAGAVGVPAHKITAIMRRAGGGFGGKLTRHLPHVCAAAVAAKFVGASVRLTLDRNQDMRVTGGRHHCDIEYEVGFSAEGVVQALSVECWMNAGVSQDCSDFCVMSFAKAVDQAYSVDDLDIQVHSCKTDLPTRTAMRGPGEIQASFAIESVIEHVATHLLHHKLGPAAASADINAVAHAVRERNFMQATPGTPFVTHEGIPIDCEELTMPKVWAGLVASSKWEEWTQSVLAFNAKHRWRKRGLAMTPVKYFVRASFMGAMVNCFNDGTVLVTHGGCEIGQGIHTKVIQTASHALGQLLGTEVPMNKIRTMDTNSSVVPNMAMTGGSTTSEAACEGVRLACAQLVERLQPVRKELEEDMCTKHYSKAHDAWNKGDEGEAAAAAGGIAALAIPVAAVATVAAAIALKGQLGPSASTGAVGLGVLGVAAASKLLLMKKRAHRNHALKDLGPAPKPTWDQVIGKACSGGKSFGMIDLSSQASFRRFGHEEGKFKGKPLAYHNFGAAASEVEVDVLTGETTIVRTDILYDCGKSLNPAIDMGQAEGGFMQGVGFYLREQLTIDGFNNHDFASEPVPDEAHGADSAGTGVVTSDGTWEYKPPCNFDVPLSLNVAFLQDGTHRKGILSSKASGEPTLVLSTAVFAALRHAIEAARQEQPELQTEHFRLDAPATVDRIQAACAVDQAALVHSIC
jgi:indole-3-acetaldehyde oxidase